MPKVGDIVVYPMHGAGVIENVEECEIMGEHKSYYVLKLPMGSMKVMIPVDNADNIGLREVIGEKELEEVVAVLKGKPDKAVGSWNKRFQSNLDRMKTGDLKEVAKVARNLIKQDKDKRISSGEKRLMDLSKQILVTELVYAAHKNIEETEKWLDEIMTTKGK